MTIFCRKVKLVSPSQDVWICLAAKYPTLILLVSSLLVYHYSAPSQPAPAGAIASPVFTGAGR